MNKINVKDKSEGEIYLAPYYKLVRGTLFGDYLVKAWHYDPSFCQLHLDYINVNCNNGDCS